MSIAQVSSTLLYGAAGFCIFLMLLNRVLILMPESRFKAPVILLVFLAIMIGSAVLGFSLHRPPWVFAPVIVLCLILLGEARRALIRRSCAGSMPVDSMPRGVDLFNPITTTALTTRRYEVRFPNWRGALLRIVHITDLHVHSKLSVDYYRYVLELAEQTQPDLAVFTGDFVAKLDSLPKLQKVLRPVARVETFAVLGNHDYWTHPEAISRVVMDSGLRLLTNESATMTVDGSEIMVTGYDHPWGAKRVTIPSQRDGALHIVLSHTPDNIYRLSKSPANIVFSGHYHAGQIRLPLLGPIVVPSIYGRRFDHGHFVVNGTHLFVASGIGASDPPLRIYCKPDMFVVDVFGSSETEASPYGC